MSDAELDAVVCSVAIRGFPGCPMYDFVTDSSIGTTDDDAPVRFRLILEGSSLKRLVFINLDSSDERPDNFRCFRLSFDFYLAPISGILDGDALLPDVVGLSRGLFFLFVRALKGWSPFGIIFG